MKHLVEFKLHAGMTPYFIAERFPFLDGPKYVGMTADDVECYIPTTLIALTETEFVDRVVAATIIASISMDDEITLYTNEEKRALAEQWLAANR